MNTNVLILKVLERAQKCSTQSLPGYHIYLGFASLFTVLIGSFREQSHYKVVIPKVISTVSVGALSRLADGDNRPSVPLIALSVLKHSMVI